MTASDFGPWKKKAKIVLLSWCRIFFSCQRYGSRKFLIRIQYELGMNRFWPKGKRNVDKNWEVLEISFSSLAAKVGSNFDIIWKKNWEEELTMGIPFFQFVEIVTNRFLIYRNEMSSNFMTGFLRLNFRGGFSWFTLKGKFLPIWGLDGCHALLLKVNS